MKLEKEIVSATKWSGITELISKLVLPITNIILARLLAPEVFGIITSITMIITFAELFTDAGFQKYLIQHNFHNSQDKEQSINVAFWSNLFLSIIIWGVIFIFRESIATKIGNVGMGNVISIACLSIPLAAFSSIQMALYKRNLNFETLFKVRIVGICIPLIITIPLAFFFRNYWALIIGTLSRDFANAILLTFYSNWKPKLYFSFAKLKEMFSFTLWSLIEAISIWLTTYVDIFIVGTLLSQYYLGLYKTSMIVVAQITGIITATTTPILFSALSRLQDDKREFLLLFFKFQKIVGMLVMPIGVSIYCYSDLIIKILGQQWTQASHFIGLWGLTSSITIILAHYSSEVYRSCGKPKLSVLAQWMHIVVLWPAIMISIKYGFETLCTVRALIRLEGVVVNLCIMYFAIKISVIKMIVNILPECGASVVMMTSSLIISFFFTNDTFLIRFIQLVFNFILYFSILCFFRNERNIYILFVQGFKRKLKNK